MSFITYSRDEIISSSQAARSFKALLDDLNFKKRKKFAISRNNKIEAVMFSPDALDELLEHIEIYSIVQKRKNSKRTVTLDKIRKKHNV